MKFKEAKQKIEQGLDVGPILLSMDTEEFKALYKKQGGNEHLGDAFCHIWEDQVCTNRDRFTDDYVLITVKDWKAFKKAIA